MILEEIATDLENIRLLLWGIFWMLAVMILCRK